MGNNRFCIGKGYRFLFWMDTWVGNTPRATQYLDLFRCATDRYVAVSAYMVGIGDHVVWGIIFQRDLVGLEGQFLELLSLLKEVYI